MTVLPQLEEELLTAHDRRTRARWRRAAAVPVSWGGVVAAAAVCAAATIAVVAVGVVGRGRGPSVPVAGHRAGAIELRVLLRGLDAPQAYAAGERLYVSQRVGSEGAEIMVVDPSSGKVLARRRLAGTIDHMLLANGKLYVTSTLGQKTLFAPLNPHTLAGRTPGILGPPGRGGGDVGSMAVAGGWLWVGLPEGIVPVSPRTGAPAFFLPIPGGDGVQVVSDAAGQTLLDSEGDPVAHVQRRDPSTGRLLATSSAMPPKPFLAGITGGGAWVSLSPAGPAQRFDVRTLRPSPTSAADGGRSVTSVHLFDGILWLIRVPGEPLGIDCADPTTGHARASMPVKSTPSVAVGTHRTVGRVSATLLAADGSFTYWSLPEHGNPSSEQLLRITIPRDCR